MKNTILITFLISILLASCARTEKPYTSKARPDSNPGAAVNLPDFNE